MFTVKHMPLSLELQATIKGRRRRTGTLSVLLDASTITRSASVDGMYVASLLSVEHCCYDAGLV